MKRGDLFPPVTAELIERFYATHHKLCIESPANIADYLSLDVFGTGITPADVVLPGLKVNIDALPSSKHDDLHDSLAPLFDQGQRWGKGRGRAVFRLEINLSAPHALGVDFLWSDLFWETYDKAHTLKDRFEEVEARGGIVDVSVWILSKKISVNLRDHMDDRVDWEKGIER
jgi:hypothetical protein